MRHFSRKDARNAKDNFQLSIMNYELFFGVPAIAVGLSAISFSASLQKDAAPIPNALVAAKIKSVQTLECVHNTKYFHF